MARRDEGLALVAVLIAFIAIGAAPPSPPEPYDIHANPWMTLPNDFTIPMTGGECDDGAIAGTPLDDDGDGYANEADPSCIKLTDTNGNGICDTRAYNGFGMETDPEYETDGCTGWE